MNFNTLRKNRIISFFATLTAIIACISVCVFSIVSNSIYIVTGFIATLLLAAAIILPIHQKRFSFYSIVLVVSSILFILSGVVDYAHRAVVMPLPDKNQFEFLEFMRPLQVSQGLAMVALGIMGMATSFVGFQKEKEREKPMNSVWQFLWWVWAIGGILLSIMGIDSIIEGLRKL